MTDDVPYRYRAYLSYSHTDATWAKWLHRALESYRIPRRLRDDVDRDLPERLAPVFRDRDDLSSASDLSKTLDDALAESEHLVVLCSPAAAASRWVNEEIRAFQALGRGDRIHCLVVDGDPQAPAGEGGCFPPALFEGGVSEGGREGAPEPLAADPRAFADGKRLALQKLVAGMLGLRLDALRRRDLARRRRRQLATAAVSVAALVLVAVTITTRIAERQARDRAEEMAAFIVDLGDDLQDEIDLEALGRISTTAMGYLERLDPARLSPETRLKVGLALRQVGEVNYRQGKTGDAEAAYARSHQVFTDLYQAYPERDEVVFELTQSEFYLGEFERSNGNYDRTLAHWRRYYEIARERHQAAPGDRTWLLEYSYASSNLTNFRISRDEPVDAAMLEDIERNIELAGRALEAWEGDTDVMGHYGNELAWAADAQLGSCRLNRALRSREAALAIARQLAERNPGSRSLELDVAYRYAGLAGVHSRLGRNGDASAHLAEALSTIRSLLARDPSSQKLREDLAYYQLGYARSLRQQGALPDAEAALDEALPTLQATALDARATNADRDTLLNVLEEIARLALAGQDEARAGAALDRHRRLRTEFAHAERAFSPGFERLITYRYLAWRLDRRDPATLDPSLLDTLPRTTSAYRGCAEADAAARHAFLIGDRELLAEQVDYLDRADYGDRDYRAFCRTARVCVEAEQSAVEWDHMQRGDYLP